jgi:enamine deaminase RidA (YjgF/YER057c/UK114 family)
MSVEQRVRELGLELPPAPRAVGVYRPLVVQNRLAYLSGHGPLLPDESVMCGRLGENVTVEQGYQAARRTGLAMLATLRSELGTLDRVLRLIKLVGMVNSTPQFDQHPAVINGCSELLAQVFGESAGVAARSAFGVAALPAGWMVEIDAIFEIEPQ